MGCPRHLQWSPIKEESVAEESVEPSQGISPRGGLKGKRQREKRLSSFFQRRLLPRALSLLGFEVFACSSLSG